MTRRRRSCIDRSAWSELRVVITKTSHRRRSHNLLFIGDSVSQWMIPVTPLTEWEIRTEQKDKRRVDWRTVRDRKIVRKQRLIDEWQSDIWIKLLFVIISTYTRTTHNYHHVGCKELLSAGAEDSACAGNAEILADARVVPAIDQAAIVAREKDKIVGGVGARETEIG